MAPEAVVLIRHAQAEHNVGNQWLIPDPHLTELGRQQAASLPRAYPALFDQADVILTSPLKRTVETTLVGFPRLKERKVPLVILPDLQETASHPCDTGSSRQELERTFPHEWCDFSNCTEGWNVKSGRYSSSPEALQRRALDVRRYIRNRKEKVVVVVCHAGFLRQIMMLPHEHLWANVEARVFRFPDASSSACTNGTNDPPLTDKAFLVRIPEEEEKLILGDVGNQEILAETY